MQEILTKVGRVLGSLVTIFAVGWFIGIDGIMNTKVVDLTTFDVIRIFAFCYFTALVVKDADT